MQNVILTVHLKIDGKETAIALAKVITEMVPAAISLAVEFSPEPEARIKLGRTILETHEGEFIPNA